MILDSVILTINKNCHTSAEWHRQAVDTCDHKCTAELTSSSGKFSPAGGGSQAEWRDGGPTSSMGRDGVGAMVTAHQREWAGLRIAAAISLIRMISVLCHFNFQLIKNLIVMCL